MDINDIRTMNNLKRFKVYGISKILVAFRNEGFKGVRKHFKNKKEAKERAVFQSFDIEKNDLYIVYDKEPKIKEIEDNEEIKKLVKENNLTLKFVRCIKKYSKKNFNNSVITKVDLERNFYYKTFVYYAKDKSFIKDVYNAIEIDNASDLIHFLKNKRCSMRLYSNYCDKNNVSARTTTFFHLNGANYYNGGAERYLVDLFDILSKQKINLNIYQEADFPFFRKYRNVNVFGVASKNKPKNYTKEYYSNRCNAYESVSRNNCQLHVYSAFFEAYPEIINPSIGISHGVAWDNEFVEWIDGYYFQYDKQMIVESAKKCNRLISVDTNTTNWFQTLDYEIGAHKFELISNYVDVKAFTPRADYLKERDKIIITYPRRLYKARGLYIILDIAEKLITKHKNVEIHFVGKGEEKDLNEIKKVMKKFPNNVFCYFKDPREMPDVYKMTDISVIPTMYSEGTSLSCLEAMASGNIVVATRIGGLSDLVLDRYNGYLIEPNADSIFEALDDAVTNYKDRLVMKKRAIEVAESFNKDKWIKKWSAVFKEFNLKNSTNTELVEYYLEDFEKTDDKILDMIKKDLTDNKLVYVRMEDEKKSKEYSKKYSGERLQFVSAGSEEILDEHTIYVEKSLSKKYKFDNSKIL